MKKLTYLFALPLLCFLSVFSLLSNSASALAPSVTSPCTLKQLTDSTYYQQFHEQAHFDGQPYAFGKANNGGSYFYGKNVLFLGVSTSLSDAGVDLTSVVYNGFVMFDNSCNSIDVNFGGEGVLYAGYDNSGTQIPTQISELYLNGSNPVAPPAEPPINWDFTAFVTGLKVHFKADVYGNDPTTVFSWDFLGDNIFIPITTGVTDTSTNNYTNPVTGLIVTKFIHHTVSEFDYNYSTIGNFDVQLDTVSSNGIHKYTHQLLKVGGTGVYTTSYQNGSVPKPAKAECGGTDVPCIIGSLFTPDFDMMSTSFNSLKTSFETHLGFIAYPFTWISSFYNTLLNSDFTVDLNTCGVNLGDVYGVPYNLNYCLLQESLPMLFSFFQTALIGTTSILLMFELNRKLQGVLNK